MPECAEWSDQTGSHVDYAYVASPIRAPANKLEADPPQTCFFIYTPRPISQLVTAEPAKTPSATKKSQASHCLMEYLNVFIAQRARCQVVPRDAEGWADARSASIIFVCLRGVNLQLHGRVLSSGSLEILQLALVGAAVGLESRQHLAY